MVSEKQFYTFTVAKALIHCYGKGRTPLYMPEVVNLSPTLDRRIVSGSIRATGKTPRGSPIVLYAHVPHYFNNAKNLENAKLVDGAGILPESEFHRLLKLEGKGVFVVEYEKLNKSVCGDLEHHAAMSHPQTVPFLGKQASKFLEKSRNTTIQSFHSADLGKYPVARFLMVNPREGILNSWEDFGSNGCFVIPYNKEEALVRSK